MTDLRQAVTDRVALRDTLLREYPELEDDDAALSDTLQGLDNFEERVCAVLRWSLEQEATAKALGEMIERMQERKRRLEAAGERGRDMVLDALQVAGVDRPIRAADMTVSVQKGRGKVIITNEAAVPDALCKIVRTPNKKDIAAVLADGRDVPGAVLSNPVPFLTIRRS